MIKRCENKKDKSYKYYGGRGINVCKDWHSFESFYQWAINHGYKESLTIDRIDVNKNYCPENCRWIPFEEQSKNKRSNRWITYNNETKTLTEWSKCLGINLITLHSRLKNGWSIERAFTTEPKRK